MAPKIQGVSGGTLVAVRCCTVPVPASKLTFWGRTCIRYRLLKSLLTKLNQGKVVLSCAAILIANPGESGSLFRLDFENIMLCLPSRTLKQKFRVAMITTCCDECNFVYFHRMQSLHSIRDSPPFFILLFPIIFFAIAKCLASSAFMSKSSKYGFRSLMNKPLLGNGWMIYAGFALPGQYSAAR
jgi:hypothetical protein